MRFYGVWSTLTVYIAGYTVQTSAYYIQIDNDLIILFFKLQCLQRGEEGTEPLELENWYENTWKLWHLTLQTL